MVEATQHDPKELGEEYKSKHPKMSFIKLQDKWIRRTHRSHKPLMYKEIDEKAKTVIIKAWQDEKNNSWSKICEEVAKQTK